MKKGRPPHCHRFYHFLPLVMNIPMNPPITAPISVVTGNKAYGVGYGR
jgi:hypothetical protein